jgi:hypothetical protein
MQVAPEALPGGDGTLAVVQALPRGAAHGLIRPTITFSKPVVALGTVEVEKARAAPATIQPAIPGDWKWLGSASVEFTPGGLWPYSTRFTVTVAAGLTAVDGSALKEAYAYIFETPRPVVQQIEPGSGWRSGMAWACARRVPRGARPSGKATRRSCGTTSLGRPSASRPGAGDDEPRAVAQATSWRIP